MIAAIVSIWASPIGRKIIVYGGLALALFLALRWYGNRQWEQGVQSGREQMAVDLEKQKQAEWEAREKEIAAAAESLAADKKAVAAAAEQLGRDRAALSRSMTDALERIRAERTQGYVEAAAVSDADIWAAIRAVSRQLSAESR